MYISLACQAIIDVDVCVVVTLVSRNLVTFCDRKSQNSRKNREGNMGEKQQNERKATRFDGVYQRPSRTKKYEGKPDVTYTIDYYDPHTGKRVRKTIGNRSSGITAEYANSVRQSLLATARKEVVSGILPQEVKSIPTLGEAWERYKTNWLEAHVKSSAYNDTSSYNKHLKEHELHNRPLNKISVTDFEELTLQKRREGYAPQTIKHILALIRRIINKAKVWKMWRGDNPFDDFTMPEVDNERTRFLTEKEAKLLLDKLRDKDRKIWIMSLLALQCGMRFSEIARLVVRDLDFNHNTIFIRLAKNGRSRFAIMPQAVKQALQEWVQNLSGTLLFPNQANAIMHNIGRTFDEVVEEMGLNKGASGTRDRFVFHSLRHTFASFLAKNGYGQAVIAELLGHRSLEMTRRYTHLMPDTRHAAAGDIDRIIGGAHLASPQ